MCIPAAGDPLCHEHVILEVRDLSVEYSNGSKRVQAVDGVSFSLRRGTVLPRCRKATTTCRTSPSPPLGEPALGQQGACHNPVYHSEE